METSVLMEDQIPVMFDTAGAASAAAVDDLFSVRMEKSGIAGFSRDILKIAARHVQSTRSQAPHHRVAVGHGTPAPE